MADSATLRLEDMLPEVAHFQERNIFTKDELSAIMLARRKFEYAICSRSANLQDYMKYIQHEIDLECRRRQKFQDLKIKKTGPKDASIIRRVHDLFGRCVSRYSSDIDLWTKYIDFCASSGSSNQLNRALIKAIKRHPRVARFRVLSADRELQLGALSEARKLLMRAIRVKTDNHRMIWEQLFKLECVAVHRMVTAPSSAEKTEASEPSPEKPVSTVIASCQPACVVLKHGMADLAKLNQIEVDRFIRFASEAVNTLDMSILGFAPPVGLEELKDLVSSAIHKI
jgi:U3 small nucleolar RNA-associated protein 6